MRVHRTPLRKLLGAFALLTMLVRLGSISIGHADEPDTAGDEVRAYLETHAEYLLENWDLVQRSLEFAQKQEEVRRTERNLRLLNESEFDLLSPKESPNRGKRHAKMVIVEFSDYQCIPCRRSHPAIEELLTEREDLRVVHLQLPIYGDNSNLAAKVAVIAHHQGKFEAFHIAMMQLAVPVTWSSIRTVATSVGIDVKSMEEDITQSRVSTYLDRVKTLAERLDVVGTPTFFINGKAVTGAVDIKKLRKVSGTN